MVLPLAAVIAVGTLAASYHSAGRDWRESALVLQQRGLDALRAVTAQPPPRNGPSRDAGRCHTGTCSGRSDSNAFLAGRRRNVDRAASRPAAGAPSPPAAVAEPAGVTTASTPPPASAPSVLSFGVTGVNAREDHSVVAIDVVRSGDTTHEAAVGWWTSPDTAHEDDDYASIGRQTVTFPAGATVERVLIPIVNDGVRESDEVFTVHLSRPRGGVAGSVTATRVTLHDDD